MSPTMRPIFFCLLILAAISWLAASRAFSQNAAPVVTKTGDELIRNIKEWHEPKFPAIARQTRAGGPVEVDLMIDEQGNVVSAKVISGHPLLQAAVLQAARAWKFNPITMNGVAVRVKGSVTYTYPISEPPSRSKIIRELEIEVRKKPKSAEAHYKLGVEYFEDLRYSDAINQLSEAIRLNSKDSDAHLKLGHAYARLHAYEKARAAYIEAGRLDPTRSETLHALGQIYMGLGDYEEAIVAFEKSLKLEDPITSTYFLLGKCQVLLGRASEAVGFYKQGLDKYPESDVGHYGLGEAYLELEQYSKAITEFKEALKLSEGPGKSATHYHLGLAYVRSGDWESALKEYEALKKLNEELAQRLLMEIRRLRKDIT